MFEPIKGLTNGAFVHINVEGRPVRVRGGTTVAIALLEAGFTPLRQSVVSGAPRAPLCLMGVCFECVCEIDGRQNAQACMVDVADGMRVRLSKGARRMEIA